MNQGYLWQSLLRLYLMLGLAAATIFSASLFSLLPAAFLALSLYFWFRKSEQMKLALAFGAIFILPLVLEPVAGGPLAALATLPLFAHLDMTLRKNRSAVCRIGLPSGRHPTDLGILLLTTVFAVGLVGVFLGDSALELTSLACLVYFGIVAAIITASLPQKPLQESRVSFRAIAGSQSSTQIHIPSLASIGGQLYLRSTYPWLAVTPPSQSLSTSNITATIVSTPELSGPTIPEFDAVAVDAWGLSQVAFKLQPVQMDVIPRARYAVWLAKKYLDTARPGAVVSDTPSTRFGGIHVARKGGEFYGASPYQPGDNLRAIDWKHSAKLGEMIVQEFSEPYTSSPLLLVNLSAPDEEEADKLAYSIITTAITLAREKIPAAIAAYNNEKVVKVTDLLPPRDLVRVATDLTDSITRYVVPATHLAPPDLSRIKMNTDRLSGVPSDAAQKLAQLLTLEYTNIKASADLNPATSAASRGLAGKKQLLQVLVISGMNHDAEAVALLVSRAKALGVKPLFLKLGKAFSLHQLSATTYYRPATRNPLSVSFTT